jgi:hypothetical protein
VLKRLGFVTVVLASCALFWSCRAPTEPLIQADGQMQLSVGGCFRIVTSSNAYQPTNLAAEFQIDGIRVHFEARLKPTFNTCMAGDVVELVSIRRLP